MYSLFHVAVLQACVEGVCLPYVPVQHDYFSSLNQSHSCLGAVVVAIGVVVAKAPC